MSLHTLSVTGNNGNFQMTPGLLFLDSDELVEPFYVMKCLLGLLINVVSCITKAVLTDNSVSFIGVL